MKITICGVLLAAGLLTPALAVAQPGPSPSPDPAPDPAAPPAARERSAQPGAKPGAQPGAQPGAKPGARAAAAARARAAAGARAQPPRAVEVPRPAIAAPPFPPPPEPPRRYTHPPSYKHVDATPAGGFGLRKKRMSFSLELGYPFLDFRFGIGISDRFQLLIGYRGLYSLSSAGFAGMKLGLYQNKERTVGIAFVVLGGYTYVKNVGGGDGETTEMLIGGNGGFGEGWLMATVRRGRHGLTLTGGIRLSQVSGCSAEEYDCYNPIFESGRPGTLATAFFELGWEMRVMKFASYYVAMGVDMFANSYALPAMVRFRTGVMLDF